MSPLFTVDVCGPSLHSTQLPSPCMVVFWVVFLLGYACYRTVAVSMHINVIGSFETVARIWCAALPAISWLEILPLLSIQDSMAIISHNGENKAHSRQASSTWVWVRFIPICFTISQRVCTPCVQFLYVVSKPLLESHCFPQCIRSGPADPPPDSLEGMEHCGPVHGTLVCSQISSHISTLHNWQWWTSQLSSFHCPIHQVRPPMPGRFPFLIEGPPPNSDS